MVYIYVLKCQGNKFYVGKTEDPQFRLDTHFKEGGSVWTKKYKPIQIHELIPDQTDHDEQRVTQEYMGKYGIDNVRGGPWCRIDISESLSAIQHILKSNSDKCYNCGSNDHFAQQCKKVKQIKSKPKIKPKIKPKSITCQRCDRSGHSHEKCYAKTYSNGEPIIEEVVWMCEYCNKEFETKKGCLFHENVHCTKRKLNKKFDPPKALYDELYSSGEEDSSEEEYSSEEVDIVCYRCGRPGHYAPTCYATKHINGSYLE